MLDIISTYHECGGRIEKFVPRISDCYHKACSVMTISDHEGQIFLSHPHTNEPVHEISNNLVCATSKSSDQPAHTRSLIRAFASRLSIL